MPTLRAIHTTVACRCTNTTNTTLQWDVRFCVGALASKVRCKTRDFCSNDVRLAIRCPIPTHTQFESRASTVIQCFGEFSDVQHLAQAGLSTHKLRSTLVRNEDQTHLPRRPPEERPRPVRSPAPTNGLKTLREYAHRR